MKKVWTASQGTIHSPSPRPRPVRPSRPFDRFGPLCANSAWSASSVDRVRLRITMRGCFEELSASAKALIADRGGLEEFISAQNCKHTDSCHLRRCHNWIKVDHIRILFRLMPQHALHAGASREPEMISSWRVVLLCATADQLGLQQHHHRRQHSFRH